MGKAVVAAISLILVVGAVIGTVVIVKERNKNGTPATGGSSSGGISTGMKAVDTLCSPTKNKDLCIETLSPVAKGDTNASPKAFVEASFQATIKAVNQALIDSKSLDKETKDKYDVSSLEVCKKYIEYAAEDLERAISKISKSDMKKTGDLARDLNIMLSAVLSYKSTCVEEMDNPKLKEALQGGVLLNTTQLAENGLAIVEGIAQFLENINLDLSALTGKQTNRRLLDIGEDGYPTWLSASDRKLLQVKENAKPHVTVAKDGSGQFKTIQEAVNSYPKKHQGRYIIYVKKGIYQEYVTIDSKTHNIYMYGDGAKETIVTGNRNYKIMGIKTSQTATFSVMGNGFMAKAMGFQNTAGPQGHQAVALLTKGDYAAFYDCVFEGYQDTLYYQANKSFYRNCVISGTVDFIFGRGAAVIQNSEIIVRKPEINQFNCVTADGTDEKDEKTGLVLQNCVIKGEPALIANKNIKTYLGRPWGEFARTIFMESDLPDFIIPEGYNIWNATSTNHLTADYKEFANRGPGANAAARVKWPSFAVVTDPKAVERFTTGQWLLGGEWLPETGVPFELGFSKAA
ncbi:pectinesterase [Ranunculus cassubicifolius]